MKVKEESEKVGLKLNIQKTKIMAWQIDGETMETGTNFILVDSKITADGDCSHEIKRHFLGVPGGSDCKESACTAGDLGSIPGLGRTPGEGKDYPFQHSGRENSRDCIVHAITKSRHD